MGQSTQNGSLGEHSHPSHDTGRVEEVQGELIDVISLTLHAAPLERLDSDYRRQELQVLHGENAGEAHGESEREEFSTHHCDFELFYQSCMEMTNV